MPIFKMYNIEYYNKKNPYLSGKAHIFTVI